MYSYILLLFVCLFCRYYIINVTASVIELVPRRIEKTSFKIRCYVYIRFNIAERNRLI